MIDASDESSKEATSSSSCPVDHASTTSEASYKLTPRDIVGSSVTFLLAGYETTANTLSYTSYLLAINPDIQAKLQSEIDSYFDDKPVSFRFQVQRIAHHDGACPGVYMSRVGGRGLGYRAMTLLGCLYNRQSVHCV